MRIIHSYVVLWSLSILLSLPTDAHAQNSEIEKIAAVRNASNEALAAFDHERDFTYMTEDVHNTTGNGIIINGKEELRTYIQNAEGIKMYWIRTPDEVVVNEDRGLAWESGTWKGYYTDSENPLVGGKYSAHWTKASGQWLIKSQLFVTLEKY